MKVCEFKSIREAIHGMAQEHPDVAFLIDPLNGARVQFQELEQQSQLLARMLHHAGLKKGDKVAFLMDNGLLTAQLFLGAMYGGYVAVPLNVRAGAAQLSYMLDHCDAKVVFIEEQYIALLREAAGDVRRDIRVIHANVDGPLPVFEPSASDFAVEPPAGNDVALLMYSSGSTGKPKGAIHTHSSILSHGRNSIEAHQLSATDRSLLVLPLYHINAECVTLVPTLLCGGSVVVAHRFDVSRFWDWIDDFHVTWSALVPTIISELVDWNDPGKDRRQAAFQRIRFFRSSSAPLSPTLHRQFLDKFELPLLQAMGSTEGGNVFSNPVPPGKNKIGSPGLPWGFDTRIVDREGRDVPRGESGEVLLRGAGMMQGYYKDSEGTAAVLDPDGWLHTGDLARQDEDGYFFIVGRSKELIIKGGVNIAPRQIDEVLESHAAVLEAAAVGVPDRYLGEDAVAFVVLRSELKADERELLAFCETRLGHFKTPSRIHFLKELPKGPSGKVQRLRLLDPSVLASVAVAAQPNISTVGIDSAAPGNRDGAPLSIEEVIAASWAEVLALPQIDHETNFFALGGHSLLAIQCLSKLREKLPVILTLADFFEFSTVAEQAGLVRRRLREASGSGNGGSPDQSENWEQTLLRQYIPAAEDAIPHVDSSMPRPLSPAQQRVWFMEQMIQDVPVYNEAEAVRLTGELNVEALKRALNQIVARHALLRSTIQTIEGVPHAVVHESWPLRFKEIDLSGPLPVDRQAEVDRLLIDEPRLRYDLEAEPGIRVTLLRLSDREHILILMMHHIICDWSSEGIIWRELSALYRSFVTGTIATLPVIPVTHEDYARWKQEQLSANSSADSLAFWEETLKGAPALLELPADRPRPPIMSYRGSRLRFKLSRALTEALRSTSRQEKTSLFTIFAASLDTLLYRYTGTSDILLGIPLADRDRQELQSLIGFLLHTHVLRNRVSGEMSFRDLLSQVQKAALDLYMHRSVQFDQIVRQLRPERNLSYTPLFQVMLNWRDRDQQLSFIGMEGLTIDSLMASANTSKFDLFLFVTDCGDEIWLELEYNTDLFNKDRMMRMLGHYQVLLEAVASDPGQSIRELPLLSVAEHQEIVVDWNRTERGFPQDKCFDELFRQQAERTPHAVAVTFEDENLTYRQLAERTDDLAAYLQHLGVGRNTLVAICMERSAEMLIGLLGILKAGGAYLPLDPSFPPERLTFMLQDAQPLVLLTQRKLRNLFPSVRVQSVFLDALPPTLDGQPSELAGRQAEDLAYVLYTSGSTGTPKGVQIQHRALVNFLTSMQLEPGIAASDTLLAITTLSFDIAGLELYLPLMVGARVVIAPGDTAKDGEALIALMKACGATIMQATPATWRMLLDSGWQGRPGLKILCGGEAWSTELASELLPRCESLWNMYGPTETTIWSSASRIEKDRPVRIGAPIANTTFYVLDSCGQPLPLGIPGELHIGGLGLAQGYLWRDDLTHERFVPNPFNPQTDARLYRTGDLVRRAPDGSIEFLQRVDGQIKLRGFRIELGEIEVALEQHSGIHQCVVTVQGDSSADKHLVAYIVPTNPRDVPQVKELREALKERLPSYMIPAAFAFLEKMPLTPNGKIDRRALPHSDLITIVSKRPIDTPRDSIEAKLVQIWEQVLAIHPVGIRTNFFEVGGYSLLVAKLFAQMNKAFDRSLPIAAIFQSPTIEQLATLIRGRSLNGELNPAKFSESQGSARSSIVPIQPHGSIGPLFMVHGILGDVFNFYHLARLLGTDHCVYGIQAQSLLKGQPALLRLEDQAAYYVSEMQKIQPRGPYYLLGYCFGGLVAFEIAHLLHAAGEQVKLLGMLDSRAYTLIAAHEETALMQQRGRRTEDVQGGPSTFSVWNQFASRMAASSYHVRHRIYKAAVLLGMRSIPFFMKRVAEINVVAKMFYRLRPFPGQVTLFRASEHTDLRLPRDFGWGQYAESGVEIYEVAGDHDGMLGEQNVPDLAEKLRSWLERSDAVAAKLDEPAFTAK